MKRLTILWMLILSLCAAYVGTARADQDDPPSRVARLDLIDGSASMQPAGVDDWIQASVNRPLTTSDRLWTAARSRAELHVGSTALRVGGETSLTFTRLDDNTVQLQLAQGTLYVHVRKIYENETYEVDTPNGSFTIVRSGEYRFDVDSNGDVSTAMVRSGEVNAWSGDRSVAIHGGELGTFRGDNFAYDMGQAPGYDDFDKWCTKRDYREDESLSARYVSRDMPGYYDLDSYGSWRVVPDYGPMWVPVVVSGWAPYRYGHWVWIDPWGWTWVDDAPWGFAPFHYGRWVYYGGYWGWCPGPVIVRPYYAPALVAWVGGQSWGVAISFGFGSPVGWVPLGWGEVYSPWYHASPRYWNYVNRTTVINNTTIINNYYNYYNGVGPRQNLRFQYANYRVNGAVSVVPAAALKNSQPINKVVVTVPPKRLSPIEPQLAPQVVPEKSTVTGGHAPVEPGMKPPERVLDRRVVAKNAPPVPPVPFDQQRPALEKNQGRPLDPATEANLRHNNPPTMQGGKPGSPAAGAHGAAPDRAGFVGPANGPRHEVPRPPDAQNANDRNSGRVPMPRDNGVVRNDNGAPGRDVPQPQANVSSKEPVQPGSRVPRPSDDSMGAPSNGEGRRYVPKPPDSGSGTADRQVQPSTRVPRPSDDNVAAPSSGTGRQDVSRPQDTGGVTHHDAPATRSNDVPRPGGGGAERPQYTPPEGRPQPSNGGGPKPQPQVQPQRPQNESHPAPKPQDNKDSQPQRNNPTARNYVPRPPADYSYRSTPAPQSYDSNAQGYRPAPQQNSYRAPEPSYRPAPAPQSSYRSAPEPSYRPAPQQSYRSAPAQSYRAAPQQSYRSVPAQNNRSAPSNSHGGSNARSDSGGRHSGSSKP